MQTGRRLPEYFGPSGYAVIVLCRLVCSSLGSTFFNGAGCDAVPRAKI